MPNYLYVEDDANNQNCARALYKDQVQDFGLGPGNSLNLLDDLDIDFDNKRFILDDTCFPIIIIA